MCCPQDISQEVQLSEVVDNDKLKFEYTAGEGCSRYGITLGIYMSHQCTSHASMLVWCIRISYNTLNECVYTGQSMIMR